MLKGAELLAKIQEMGETDRASVLRACGYVNTKKDGSERLNFTAFCEAIVEAKGVSLAPPATKSRGSRGKAPSYQAKLTAKGIVPIGAAYTSEAGWDPADVVTISVEGGKITLERATATEAKRELAPF